MRYGAPPSCAGTASVMSVQETVEGIAAHVAAVMEGEDRVDARYHSLPAHRVPAMVEGIFRSLYQQTMPKTERQAPSSQLYQTSCRDRSTNECPPYCPRTTKRCGSMRTVATPHTLTLRFPHPYPGDTFVYPGDTFVVDPVAAPVSAPVRMAQDLCGLAHLFRHRRGQGANTVAHMTNRIDVRLIHNRPQPVHRLSQSPMCEIAWSDARVCRPLVVCAKWSTILTRRGQRLCPLPESSAVLCHTSCRTRVASQSRGVATFST